MGCNKPLFGWLSKENNGFTQKYSEAYPDFRMQVPCGQCMGCRISKTSAWATRIMHEAQTHPYNSFITLTYNDENLPKKGDYLKTVKSKKISVQTDNSLEVVHLQQFIKKLRKYCAPSKLRYYACGEYGNEKPKDWYIHNYGRPFGRPHFHCIIFNYWPEDLTLMETTNYGNLYTSEKLTKIWNKGFTTVGSCTFESAAYTAAYVTKKITGDLAATHYGKCTPEFGVMSRKPGIAREWYNQYKSQTWGNNSVIIRGHEVAPPQYYKKQLKEEDPILFLEKKLDGIQKHRALEELAIEEKYLKLKQDYFKKHKI